jgi:hypothetical protein
MTERTDIGADLAVDVGVERVLPIEPDVSGRDSKVGWCGQ